MNSTRLEYEESGDFPLEVDGEARRFPRFCPHRAGRLDHGYVNWQRKTLTCPLHHSMFCLRTGQRLRGPECDDLAAGGAA